MCITERQSSETLTTAIANAVSIGATETLSAAYVAGFIATRLFTHLTCQICNDLLLSTPEVPHNAFIAYREWSDQTSALTYLSEAFVVPVGRAVTYLECLLENCCAECDIGKKTAEGIKQ